MNSQHYTHLVKIRFNDDPGVYYDGYFDLKSAKKGAEWQKEYLAKEGHSVKSIEVVKANR